MASSSMIPPASSGRPGDPGRRRARWAARLARFGVIGAGLVGCTLDNPPEPPPSLDYDTFVCVVQPVLATECSFPACHGNEHRAWQVLAPGRMRLSDQYALARAELSLDELEDGVQPPLTGVELRFNYAQARAFAPGGATESPLLTRPLAEAAGGRLHAAGGDVFSDPHSDGYRAIERWLLGQRGGCGP